MTARVCTGELGGLSVNRSIVVALTLAACSSEQNFIRDIQEYPNSVAPPLRDAEVTDTIVQVSTPRVDILWMVDNSCSMSNEQDELAANFPFFMDYFLGSGLDYHIGVTSSDTISDNYPGSSGTLVEKNGYKYIEPTAPEQVALFVAMASLGTTGRFPERGLGGTYLALEVERDRANAGFYRDEAALHTICISDEPDFTQIISQPEYEDWYDGLKPEEERTFSAIIDPNRGTDYVVTAQGIGGIVWSLSDQNWPQVLELLGLQAAGLKREYFLSQLPVRDTIRIEVENENGAVYDFAIDVDFSYDTFRNSVTFFEFIPDASSTVRITYVVLASQVEEVETAD